MISENDPAHNESLEHAWKLHQSGQLEDAEQLYRRVLEGTPDDPNAWCFLGMVCHDTQRFDEAVEAYHRSIKLKPSFPIALNNQGNTLRSMGRLTESIASFQAALAMEPDYPSARFNLSLSYIQQGNWEDGFAGYEWRWRYLGLKEPMFQQPRWDGSPINDQRILLHAEQGFGDTLQFVRFARYVKAQGGWVALSAPAPLLPVLSGCADIDELVAQGQDPPEFEMHAPLLSLPYILGLRLESAFAPLKVPYISADSLRSTLWRQRLSGLTKFKVGLAWQGSSTNRNSTTLEQFAPLAQVKGVQFVSLQKGIGAEQVAELRDRIVVRDLGTRLGANEQLADTAAIMTNLDLVVTVDTGIAHLAGALGIPVWIALTYAADWRWMVGRDDSPWYPSARLFRQTKPKDWSGVVGKIAEALAERIR